MEKLTDIYMSVVIVTFESYEIVTTLDLLLNQLDDKDEIVVVDDHSSRPVKTILEAYAQAGNIQLYESKNPGNRPANRNLGASQTKNPILLFIDGDMVLAEDSIKAFKEAHKTRSEIAFIGNIHGGHYDEPALDLHLGNSDYIALVKTPHGRRSLLENSFIKDRRQALIEELHDSPYFWSIYYSTYCSVDRRIFNDIGGFEEKCSLWGGEDVDLGYQISLRGEIGFLPQAHGFHIPHPRHIINNDRTNAANFKMLYRKNPVWQFEVLASYKIAPSLLPVFEEIRNRMGMLKLRDIADNVNNRCCAIIDVVSQKNPDGKIILVERDGARSTLEAMGLILHIPNNAYDASYVSDNVFVYPPVLTARILQEARRIAKETYLVCSGDTVRLDWGDIPRMQNFRPMVRTEYASSDTMDYRYTQEGSLIKVEELF